MDKPSLKSYLFNKIDAFSYFPPILDYNPVCAAQDLTINDSFISYKILLDAFKCIHKNKNKYPILQDCIMYSYSNFMWFANFFKELEKIINPEQFYKLPYFLIPTEVKEEPPLFFHPPFHLWNNHTGKFRVAPDKIRLKDKDVVKIHRVKYILNDYELEDFRNGFPNWFILKQQTIYETYNEKTNVRVRIDYLNGEFLYFIAGASDNWQQVQQVPMEIDHIVSSFLFRN